MTAAKDGSWLAVPGVLIGPLEDSEGSSIDCIDLAFLVRERMEYTTQQPVTYVSIATGRSGSQELSEVAFGLTTSEARRIAARLIEAAEFIDMRRSAYVSPDDVDYDPAFAQQLQADREAEDRA